MDQHAGANSTPEHGKRTSIHEAASTVTQHQLSSHINRLRHAFVPSDYVVVRKGPRYVHYFLVS
jgi:hypothetical protein